MVSLSIREVRRLHFRALSREELVVVGRQRISFTPTDRFGKYVGRHGMTARHVSPDTGER
jgi:hypothetical protein